MRHLLHQVVEVVVGDRQTESRARHPRPVLGCPAALRPLAPHLREAAMLVCGASWAAGGHREEVVGRAFSFLGHHGGLIGLAIHDPRILVKLVEAGGVNLTPGAQALTLLREAQGDYRRERFPLVSCTTMHRLSCKVHLSGSA
jgi:hypothetical protein